MPDPRTWVAAHPYLEPIGRLAEHVDRALAVLPCPAPPDVSFARYAPDFVEGVPLLDSPLAAVGLLPGGELAVRLVERLASNPPLEALSPELRRLHVQLREFPEPAPRVAAWLVGREELVPVSPGLLRCLGWLAMARWLRPVSAAYAAWRDDERWMRPWCPTCGSGPSMAHLAGKDPGRKRLLVCGACRTRWQFRRTQCPFCEADSQRLSTIVVAGESGLRLDHCETCRGYLKTYDGEGAEDVLLADWTSLHLDVLAADRGLEKRAPSLFALDVAPPDGAGAARFDT